MNFELLYLLVLTHKKTSFKLVYMITVGAFEAKTHLSSLLQKVREGEEIVNTKHGVPIARLCPYKHEVKKSEIADLIEEIKKERNKHRLEGNAIKELIEEGRR